MSGGAGRSPTRIPSFTQCSNELEHLSAKARPVHLRLRDRGRIFDDGGVAERLKAPVLKTGMGWKPHRGFESHPLRHLENKEECRLEADCPSIGQANPVGPPITEFNAEVKSWVYGVKRVAPSRPPHRCRCPGPD